MVIDEKHSITKLSGNVESILKRLNCNKVRLSLKKNIHGSEKWKTRSIFFDSHPIESVDDVKYLGIKLDSQLN